MIELRKQPIQLFELKQLKSGKYSLGTKSFELVKSNCGKKTKVRRSYVYDEYDKLKSAYKSADKNATFHHKLAELLEKAGDELEPHTHTYRKMYLNDLIINELTKSVFWKKSRENGAKDCKNYKKTIQQLTSKLQKVVNTLNTALGLSSEECKERFEKALREYRISKGYKLVEVKDAK